MNIPFVHCSTFMDPKHKGNLRILLHMPCQIFITALYLRMNRNWLIMHCMIVYSTVYSGADQGKHQTSTSLAFVRGINSEFPAQKASNTENVSIWWRHHEEFQVIHCLTHVIPRWRGEHCTRLQTFTFFIDYTLTLRNFSLNTCLWGLLMINSLRPSAEYVHL